MNKPSGWQVSYSDEAVHDLDCIYDYIANTLLEPITAENQTDRIMDAINSLDFMPLRHRLYDEEPWRSIGLRILPVDNYIVLYVPDELNKQVTIINIVYGGRDIHTILKEFTADLFEDGRPPQITLQERETLD